MDAAENIPHWFYLSLSPSKTHFKTVGYRRIPDVSVLANTLYKFYFTRDNHFMKKYLQVFSLSIEKRRFFPV
jgi:hypothetical protein